MEETPMVGRQRRGSLMVEVKERVAVLGVGQTWSDFSANVFGIQLFVLA